MWTIWWNQHELAKHFFSVAKYTFFFYIKSSFGWKNSPSSIYNLILRALFLEHKNIQSIMLCWINSHGIHYLAHSSNSPLMFQRKAKNTYHIYTVLWEKFPPSLCEKTPHIERYGDNQCNLSERDIIIVINEILLGPVSMTTIRSLSLLKRGSKGPITIQTPLC